MSRLLLFATISLAACADPPTYTSRNPCGFVSGPVCGDGCCTTTGDTCVDDAASTCACGPDNDDAPCR